MSGTALSNGVATATTLTWSGGAAPALAQYTYSAPSDFIDNTAGAALSSYRNGLLRLAFPSAQPATFNPPTRLGLFLIPALDGVNLPTPPGQNPAKPMGNGYMLEQLIPGGTGSLSTYAIVDFGNPDTGFKLGPFKYAFQLYNGTINAWSAAPTVTLYRWDAILGTQSVTATNMQATMVVPPETSTPLVSGNVVTSPNSAALPAAGSFTELTVINIGGNVVYVSWFGGTASATNGCIPIQPGGNITIDLTGSTNAPSFFSPSGTTLALSN